MAPIHLPPPCIFCAARPSVSFVVQVIWSFIGLGTNDDGSPNVYGGPDPDCVANMSNYLIAQGLVSLPHARGRGGSRTHCVPMQPTTHMISIGGWDGPHPTYTSNATAAYAAWKTWNEQVSRCAASVQVQFVRFRVGL